MSIKINNQNIVALYKGNQVITEVCKGLDLVWQLVELGMDDDIFFADPEAGRVLHANGLIVDPIKSSKRELASITSLNPSGGETTSYFYNNQVLTKFPELKYCTGLSSLYYTFRGCSNLTEVGNIPNSVTNMEYTFYSCSSLVNAPIIPEGVTNMSNTFYYCTRLVDAPTIPDSVTNMYGTFYNCSRLVNTPIIPEGVTNMEYTFFGCRSLDDAPTIPEGITNMRSTFYGCTSLVNAPIIPNSVTSVYQTFIECSSLVNAPIIPEGVTNMNQTFYSCSSLVNAPIIPDSVTEMYQTFRYCASLNGIFVIKPVTPPTYDDTFRSVNVVAIYVPDESVDVYKNASGWSEVASKIYPMSELPE